MRDLAGMSYQEMADALELPLGTVKSRLNRARLELATAVRRRVQIRPVASPAALNGGVA
jgi:RNA polymerase sigma-70 factor (ECF subfamily)